MNEEMRIETLEVVVTALEKCPNHFENAARLIKDTMDKKFGGGWNAVVGEGYGFHISSHVKHLLFIFYGGALAVLLFKGFFALFFPISLNLSLFRAFLHCIPFLRVSVVDPSVESLFAILM
jgi:dynein light chain 4